MSETSFTLIRELCRDRRGLFVCGTGTGVGKTFVAGGLAARLHEQGRRVGVLKPYASGCQRKNGRLVHADAEFLRGCCGRKISHDHVAPVCYEPAMAPAMADEISAPQILNTAGIEASICQAVEEQFAHSDILIVEGIGGPLVPLDDRRTVLDLMESMGFPVVLVTRGSLGTLNHTALAVRALRSRNLPVSGLVVNGVSRSMSDLERRNLDWLSRQNDLPVLSVIPGISDEAVSPEQASCIAGFLSEPDWLRLSEL